MKFNLIDIHLLVPAPHFGHLCLERGGECGGEYYGTNCEGESGEGVIMKELMEEKGEKGQ